MELRFRCKCGWEGTECQLINPSGVGNDQYVEGESCPECWNDDLEDITDEKEIQ